MLCCHLVGSHTMTASFNPAFILHGGSASSFLAKTLILLFIWEADWYYFFDQVGNALCSIQPNAFFILKKIVRFINDCLLVLLGASMKNNLFFQLSRFNVKRKGNKQETL